MIKQVLINNDYGEQLKISLPQTEPDHGLFLTEIEGLGPVKANINASKVATRDGTRYNSSRAESRDVTFHFLYIDVPEKKVTAEDARDLTYKYFPLKEHVTLTFITQNRTARCSGYVESNEPDIFNEISGSTITVNCPFPWMHLTGNEFIQEDSFSDLEPAFEFPVDDDWNGILELDPFEEPNEPQKSEIFTILNIDAEHDVYYRGECECGTFITIEVYDRISGVVKIYNKETKEYFGIDFDKISKLCQDKYKTDVWVIEEGDIIEINTRVNDKAIRYRPQSKTDVINIINAVDTKSTWLRLHPGKNTFYYTSDQGMDFSLGFTMEEIVYVQGV